MGGKEGCLCLSWQVTNVVTNATKKVNLMMEGVMLLVMVGD